MHEDVRTDKAPAAIGPYSQAVITGDFVFTSGQIPINPLNGEVVTGGIEVQAVQAFENLKNVLEASGSNLANVVKVTVFIKNMNEFSSINNIYSRYFTGMFPARSCVEVARLPKDVLIEIEAVAKI